MIDLFNKVNLFFKKTAELFHSKQEEKVQANVLKNDAELLRHLGVKATRLVGSGGFARVYEIRYAGVDAVIKLTQSRNDYHNMIRLDSLREQLGEYSKHLVNIFAHASFIYSGTNYYYVIMENLNPINSHIAQFFNRTITKIKQKYSKDTSVLKSALKNTYDLFVKFNKDLEKLTEEQINSIINNSYMFLVTKHNKPRDYLVDNLTNIINEILDNNQLSSGLANSFIEVFTKEAPAMEFPYSDKNLFQIPILQAVPEFKSFVELLVRLKDMGIDWADMHSENVMERPGTHDLIIVDPGMFSLS